MSAAFIVGLFNASYGFGILLSLLHADFAILYWLSIGVSMWAAVEIAILFGNIGVYNIWWISEQEIPLLKKIFRVEGGGSPADYPRLLVAMSYFVLLAAPLEPYFGVTFGVVFSKTLKLRSGLSLALLLTGNSLKMVLIGLGANFFGKTTSIFFLAVAILLWFALFVCRKRKIK